MMVRDQKLSNFLTRHGIVETKVPAEAHRVFKERTEGFLEIAWEYAWTPEQLKEAIERYGFDCYCQGTVDGATTVKMKPELIDMMKAAEAVPQQSEEALP
jgi:hypothetical protein